MNVRQFQHTWRKDRAEWDRVLAEVRKEQMLEPGLPGGWSVKDVIAHVNWYEQEMVVLLETRELAGSELWGLPVTLRSNAGGLGALAGHRRQYLRALPGAHPRYT
jgi:hypothetical protein